MATGPIKYTGQTLIQRDIADLKKAIAGVSVVNAFLPVVAPASVVPQHKDEYYQTPEDALFAIADALHEEYRAIVDVGLIVQLDDACLATNYDVMVPRGSPTIAVGGVRVEALNHAMKGMPQQRTRYHLCWGSWNGPHTNDVATKDIVDLVLRINVGGYSLEMANPRHEHEWRVWEKRKLPEGKTLLPGLTSHATNIVETSELVAERLVRLAKLVGRDQVIGTTDCGFAQGSFARRVHPAILWAKSSKCSPKARGSPRANCGKRRAA